MLNVIVIFLYLFFLLLFINTIFIVVFTINNSQAKQIMRHAQISVDLTKKMQAELEDMSRKMSAELTKLTKP